ncbi:MAG: HEPN domain-containing protein [Planctomycetes bacterium]|nr:HEPN domain-containing protein [Planctomycetota bacterium]
MDDAKRELVQVWLTKALSDLTSAKKLAAEPEPCPDTAIYHCQQAGEKVIKAFLVFHDQPFEKTHDLTELVELALPFSPAFAAWRDAASRLTPYAFDFRYPGPRIEPSREELHGALADATALHDFVLALLPEAVHPPATARQPNSNISQCEDEIENPDGVATVQDPICGDMMRITIRVKDGRIEDIKFKTLGCAAAIATSSITTELAKGKTLEEAKQITRLSVAEALGGLPSNKMHCSNLAAEGLHKAIEDYLAKKK